MLIRQQIDKIRGEVAAWGKTKGEHTKGVLYLSELLTSSYFYNKLVGRGLQSFRMQQARNIFIATISCLRSNTKAPDLLRHFKNQLRMIKMRQARLDPEAVLKKYQTLTLKYQRGTLPPRPRGWHENERRLFLWFLFAYYHLNYKKYSEITSKEWREFSDCFGGKDVLLLRYEAVALEKNSQRVFWSPPEEALLRDLFKSSVNGKWGDISKGLFFRSEGQYYKTSKQCREHWFNHLNTDIRKGGWTIEEDIAILTFVHNEGRHWSRLIDQIGRVRTEHMAKNRFGSLITLGRKYCNTVSEVNQNDQKILISSLIEYLSTHKALIYDNSPSSPEPQCKSDKSISIECPEMKEEAEQAQGRNEKVLSKNRVTMLDISDGLDNSQVPSFEAVNSQHYNIKRQNNEDVNPKAGTLKQQEQVIGFKDQADNDHAEFYLGNQPSQQRLTLEQQNQITAQEIVPQAPLAQSRGENESQGVAPFNSSPILYPVNPFSFTFNTIQINPPPNMQVLQPFAVFNYVIPYVPQPQERQQERE